MQEEEFLRVTAEDIADANRLSLGCPICASAVEKNLVDNALKPLACAKCQTLYHATCWEQNGGKCATLGCDHEIAYPYGDYGGPILRVGYSDLPKKSAVSRRSPNGRYKELKERERRRGDGDVSRGFWSRLFRRIIRAAGWR